MSDEQTADAHAETEADADQEQIEEVGGDATRSTSWTSRTQSRLRSAALSPFLAMGAGLGFLDKNTTYYAPGTERAWKWLLKHSYRGLKSATGADLIGHEMKRGHILHKPLIYNPDNGRWETRDGESWWNGREDGLDIYRGPGGVSCAWGASEANQLGTEVQAEYAEALDLGMGKAVLANGVVNKQTVQVNDSKSLATDGGAAQTSFSVQRPGEMQDWVVPLDKLYLDDGEMVDTRILSATKYHETYPEVVESEEHQRAEERARLAEADGDYSALLTKLLLITGAIIVLSLAAAFGLPALLGGEVGGGGTGIMPFMINVGHLLGV